MLTLEIMDQLYFNNCLFSEFMQLMASELSLKGFPLCIATGTSSIDFFFNRNSVLSFVSLSCTKDKNL